MSDQRLRESLRRFRPQKAGGELPKPGDPWGAWVEYRLKRLEDQQTWELRLILGALILNVGLQVLKLI